MFVSGAPVMAARTSAGPTPTAGLNAPPEMPPTENAPTITVKPIASPKYELPAVLVAVAVFSTMSARAKVKRNSTTTAPSLVYSMLGSGANVLPPSHCTAIAATIAPTSWATI